jgi:basic amino acid/polyamine antiporter, APA family
MRFINNTENSLIQGKNKVDLKTATTFVIANMVGTGIFTSLGFQLLDIKNPMSIMILWFIGGILALFGAFVYSEVAILLPRSGGEYNFTKEIYHPAIGFSAGWISLFVGFAAPVAVASIALGSYLNYLFPSLDKTLIAISIIIIITSVHLLNIKFSSRFQNIFTGLKVLTIILFIISGVFAASHQNIRFNFTSQILTDLKNPAFAVSLLYVSFAYSGWNASAYFTSEIKKPSRNIPLSLIIGTVIVTVLYIGLNFIFLYSAPIESMKGKIEVGIISAENIFGLNGGRIMGGIISLLLVSTISAMIFAGPRVVSVLGEDYKFFKFFSNKNKNGIPVYAIIFQSLISLIFIATSSFEQVITYIGFTLNIFTVLTVFGVFILRRKNRNIEGNKIYKTFGYPVTPVVFVVINIWFLYYIASNRPYESLIGFSFLLSGIIIYFALKLFSKNKD